jgi:osmotically-inducible protein OsmY
VSADKGRVMLDGASSNGGLRAQAEKLARGIEGVLDVNNHIHSIRNHGRI